MASITFNTVNTAALTEDQLTSAVKNFNTVFDKQIPVSDFRRQYINTPLGYSFHSLMEDGENVVGYFGAVPYTYSCFGEQKLFCYIGSLFILPEYRKDPFALYKLYTGAKQYLKENGISMVVSVPNHLSHPYFIHVLKWKEISTLPYYALPVRFGSVTRSSKVFNLFSVAAANACMVWESIRTSLINSFERQAGIFLLPGEPLMETHRYAAGHVKIKMTHFSAFYKTENEEGIRTVYLIDFYNQNGLRDSRALHKAVKYIVRNERPDLVLFIGPLRMTQHSLFKIPKSKEPRSLNFCGEITDPENINEALVFNKDSWNFGLYNFDAR